MHRNATFPVLLITAGLLWFLHSTALLPNAHSLVAIGLAVAGAAREHIDVLIIGLILSVALMGAAANVIARLLERAGRRLHEVFHVDAVGLALRAELDDPARFRQAAAALGLSAPTPAPA